MLLMRAARLRLVFYHVMFQVIFVGMAVVVARHIDFPAWVCGLYMLAIAVLNQLTGRSHTLPWSIRGTISGIGIIVLLIFTPLGEMLRTVISGR